MVRHHQPQPPANNVRLKLSILRFENTSNVFNYHYRTICRSSVWLSSAWYIGVEWNTPGLNQFLTNYTDYL